MLTIKDKQTYIKNPSKDLKPKSVKKKTNIKVFLVIVINFLHFFVYSQVLKPEQSIISFDEYVKTIKAQNKPLKPSRIESLVNDIQSSVYVERDGTKTYGTKPISLFTSVKNMKSIPNQKFDKDNIEIVNIRISNFEEIQNNIDLFDLISLKKLKYVYIIVDIKCSESDITRLVKNIGICKVFYKIADN